LRRGIAQVAIRTHKHFLPASGLEGHKATARAQRNGDRIEIQGALQLSQETSHLLALVMVGLVQNFQQTKREVMSSIDRHPVGLQIDRLWPAMCQALRRRVTSRSTVRHLAIPCLPLSSRQRLPRSAASTEFG
jgi:hypothetical protein